MVLQNHVSGNKNSYFPVVICFIISNPFEFSLHVNEKS